MSATEEASFDAGELTIRAPEGAGSNRCAAYHPATFGVDQLFSQWELVEHTPAGALGNPHQDLYIFRKSGVSA